MKLQFVNRKHRQQGQALILAVFLVLATATSAVLMYNNSQAAAEKTRLVNAADAAAYSGAVYVARNLNFMAYTNRAMIANHVAVGHFVSYVSWVRYVQDSTQKIAALTSWIPYVGAATRVANQIMEYVKQGTEYVAPYLITMTDKMNLLINQTQKKSKYTMSGVMAVNALVNAAIMEKVAKEYDPSIRINSTSDLNVKNRTGILAATQVATDLKNVFSFNKNYTAQNDDGRLKRMVEASYDESQLWIEGNRGWDLNFGLIKFNKEGSTSHSLDGNGADWKASDALIKKSWSPKGWKSSTLASGDASATEFDSSYKGIYGYYDMKKLGKNGPQTMNVSALATMPISTVRVLEVMGLKSDTARLAALSRATIFQQTPDGGFGSKPITTYANMYNPFWQVHLSGNQL